MPLLDLFWSILRIFLFFALIWVVISIVTDVFRSHDLSGFAKALWTLGLIVVPWLGVLVYLIARGDSMAQRSAASAEAADRATRRYIQDAASVSPANELEKLAGLKESGVISQAEFNAQKVKPLA
jgi:predicted membrane channel-forming protein YqfA (hemolysin III family)